MIDRTVTHAPPVAWAAQLTMTRPRPATTVEPKSASAGVGNEATPAASAAAVIVAAPDPDRPTGPPPSFDANVLEAERDRLRRPTNTDGPGLRGPDMSRSAGAYAAPVMQDGARQVDLAL